MDSSFFDWRSIFIFVDSIIALLGVSLNILLLYLIATQSPIKIRAYRLLLMSNAVNDMLTSFIFLLLLPRVIGYKLTLVVASRGLCRVIGREGTKLYTLDPRFKLLEEIKECYTAFDMREEIIYGFSDIRDWQMVYWLILMAGSVIPIYLTIFIMRRKIANYLGKQAVSQKGIKIQKELLKVLSCQALLPFLFILTIVMYISSQVTLFSYPLMECSVFSTVSLIPIISPLISIFFVRPYRSWVVWHFGHVLSTENATFVSRGSE